MKEERRGLQGVYHLGGGEVGADGTIKYHRPPRYLWLVKYDEENNEVVIKECGKWYGEVTIGECRPFFYEGCVCTYGVAENEATAEDRFMPVILASLRRKYWFLSKYVGVRYSEAKGRVRNQMIYDEGGMPVVAWPLECKIADDPTRDDATRK